MSYLEGDDDTIYALATPQGIGGISVVRISGPTAIENIKKIAPFLPQDIQSHKAYFGHLKKNAVIIDEVLVTVFLGGKSYTGENLVEVSCHGNPFIVRQIMDTLLNNGLRIARPGEFTYRAFMNNKMDLVQAESVLSLIEAQSQKSKQEALRQLKGHLSDQIKQITDDMTWVLSVLEASIDFTTEDIDVLPTEKILNNLKKMLNQVEALLSSYQGGKILKEGYQVAIAGRPNVGKSSLLNSLIEKDRSIVSPVSGTTRDLIEGEMLINGYLVRLIDTAGLREAKGTIEKIGVQRAKEAILNADLLIFVTDAYKSLQKDQTLLDSLPSLPLIKVISKKDLIKSKNDTLQEGIYISNKTREGLQDLKEAIVQKLEGQFKEASVMVMQVRHFEALKVVQKSLQTGLRLFIQNESLEFIALELQIGLKSLFAILGKEFNDEVMDKVFKEFCIGK